MELCSVFFCNFLNFILELEREQCSLPCSNYFLLFCFCFFSSPSALLLPPCLPQQFGKILDVEIIFNERGSKVSATVIIYSWTLCHTCAYGFPANCICPLPSFSLTVHSSLCHSSLFLCLIVNTNLSVTLPSRQLLHLRSLPYFVTYIHCDIQWIAPTYSNTKLYHLNRHCLFHKKWQITL